MADARTAVRLARQSLATATTGGCRCCDSDASQATDEPAATVMESQSSATRTESLSPLLDDGWRGQFS